MNYDEDKIDEYTLALLYLVSHERDEGLGARAWKGFDWDTLSRLHEKGYISNPVGKAKSVVMTEGGFLKAKELFERHFAKEDQARDSAASGSGGASSAGEREESLRAGERLKQRAEALEMVEPGD
jgi:hypothetical protein